MRHKEWDIAGPVVFWEPKDKLFRAGVRLQFRYINPHFF